MCSSDLSLPSFHHLCVLDEHLLYVRHLEPVVAQVAAICQDQGWDGACSIWGEGQKCQRRHWEEVTSHET